MNGRCFATGGKTFLMIGSWSPGLSTPPPISSNTRSWFAQRIDRFAQIVGADRVIAGSDCGFGTFAGFGAVDPEIAYAKLTTLSEGAALASGRS